MIHPKAEIIAEAGPIIIGENNLIEEQAKIINRCALCSRGLFNVVCACCQGFHMFFLFQTSAFE